MSENLSKQDGQEENRNEKGTEDLYEETAAEIVPNFAIDETKDAAGIASRVIAYASLALAILSLFFLPGILGIAGTLLSIPAIFRGEDFIGGWALSIAVFSLSLYYLILPFV